MSQERAARYSDLFAPAGERDHDHTSDCAYCPFCSAISVARRTRPDLVEHLAAAAREVTIAAGIFLDEMQRVIGAPEERPSEPAAAPANVRRIDSA